MALTAQDQARTCIGIMRNEVSEPTAYTKPQLAAAVAAVDAWVDANQAGYNSALPAAFRTSATSAQKAELLAYVLWRRIGRLRVAEDG